MHLSLLNRLHLIRTWVVSMFHNCESLPFEMRLKPMYDIQQTVFVWKEVVGKLHHNCDGLVFTPVRDPYTSGTCLKLLKWKPLEYNSADFKIELILISDSSDISLRLDDVRRYRLQVLKNGIDCNYDWISFESSDEEAQFGISGCVSECIFDFVRMRHDDEE